MFTGEKIPLERVNAFFRWIGLTTFGGLGWRSEPWPRRSVLAVRCRFQKATPVPANSIEAGWRVLFTFRLAGHADRIPIGGRVTSQVFPRIQLSSTVDEWKRPVFNAVSGRVGAKGRARSSRFVLQGQLPKDSLYAIDLAEVLIPRHNDQVVASGGRRNLEAVLRNGTPLFAQSLL
jgi:hypothetical protein